jgi:hypothetical protein
MVTVSDASARTVFRTINALIVTLTWFLGGCNLVSSAVSSTRLQPPVIFTISVPSAGSMEGGTQLTITGANFAT